jgi:hypothetical protein
MEAKILSKLWEDRWRAATCLLPSLLLVLFANRAVVPLIMEWTNLKQQVSVLHENTYETKWLDSTQQALEKEVDLLKGFMLSREAALTQDSSVQTTVDRIRGLAQISGMEVTKTTPIISRAEPLRLLKIKIEGYTPYSGLYDLVSNLKKSHSDIFLEEMLIRLGGETIENWVKRHDATLMALVAYFTCRHHSVFWSYFFSGKIPQGC